MDHSSFCSAAPALRPTQVLKPRHRIHGLTGLAVVVVMLGDLGLPLSGAQLAVDVLLVTIGFDLARAARRGCRERRWLKQFWLARLGQIAMPVTLALALVALYTHHQGALDEPALRALLGAITMSLNLFTIFGDAHLAAIEHLWLIGVVAQFAIVVPVLATGGRRIIGPKQRAAGLMALAVAVAVCRFGLLLSDAAAPGSIAINTVTRLDGLLMGLALGMAPLATLRRRAPTVLAAPSFAALLMLFVVAPVRSDMAWQTLGLLTPIAVLLTAVVVAPEATGGPRAALSLTLNNRLLRWLGERAISIYVWHHLFGYMLSIDGPIPSPVDGVLDTPAGLQAWPGAAMFTVRLVFSLAAAATSYRYLEQPAMASARTIAARSTISAPEIGSRRATAAPRQISTGITGITGPEPKRGRALTTPPPSVLQA